jgi:hypothetical protein
VLQARVIRALAVGAAALLAACSEGGPIEENVVRPGITAMEQASALTCNSDAEILRKGIEAYQLFENEPPADEAALVAAGFLREQSELHDVVNGQVTPVAVDCGGTGVAAVAPATTPTGSAPLTAPPTDVGEIVTSTEPPLTPEQMLAEFTPEEVAEVGGEACAGELASLFVAAQNYVAEQGVDPQTIEDIAAYLDQPIDLWVVQDGNLRPVQGSGCTDINDTSAIQADACHTEAMTLSVAREAYFAMSPNATEPTQADLLTAGLLREPLDGVDLSSGAIVAVPGGPCEGIDLGL